MSNGVHINSFSKGLTKDYNVLLQPDGTYTNCYNCNLIWQDNDNYAVKDCLGNVLTFSLNTRYGDSSTTFDTPCTPIGFISFPDVLVVFSTNNATEPGGYGEVGIVEYLPYGEGVMPKAVAGQNNAGYTPIYHHSNLNFTILQQIEGFAFQENESTKNVYWTDDLNEPRVINIANPVYTTHIASGDLITGKQYMVLEGIITHGGVDYGPTNGTAGAGFPGNIFTASGATYTNVTGTSPTPKVIEYVPYQLLNFTPSRGLGNIYFTGYGTGSLYCGNKIYFYRLLSPTSGIYASWSYGCAPISVHLGLTSGGYFGQVGAGTPTTLVASDKSVGLRINDIDTSFERIQIAVAEFDQLVDTPRNIAIVIDEEITGASMAFEHSSNNNLGTLTLSDLTLFPASILRCKTMTTNKNYSLIGNIVERGEIDFDATGITIEQINYAMPAQRNDDSCDNVMTYEPMDYNPFSNPGGFIEPYTKWVVTSVAGGPVVYNGNNYGLGEVIVGVPSVFAITIPVSSEIRACVSINKYTTFGGDPVPDTTLLTSGYWDYKDPAVANKIRGYWNEEKYRLGVLFYDLKGNPFYVRHAGDINTTRQTTKDIVFTESDGIGPFLYLNQTGLKVSGITIPPSLASQISGFSIVRAERDKRVLSQGMLMQTSQSVETLSGFTVVQPEASVQLGDDQTSVVSPGFYSFLCPDYFVNYPLAAFADGPTSGLTGIEEAYWLEPEDQTTGGSPRYLKCTPYDTSEVETKYFTVAPAEASPIPLRTGTILSQYRVAEKGSTEGFVGSAVHFTNITNVGNNVPADTFCNTGIGGGTFNIAPDFRNVGGLKMVMELESDTILDYNSSTVYYYDLASGLNKLMVNYVVNNDNQYGGNSAAALAATSYISTGHFQPINPTVLADVFDGVNYVFNDVEVWGGDCFTCLIDYGYGIYDDSLTKTGSGLPATSFSWGIKYPCQCNSNYYLRTGTPSRKIAPDFMQSNPFGNGVFYKIGAVTQLEGFQYNQGYSADGHFVSYPALPLNYSQNNEFKFRIRFGGPKIPGEIVNSFRTYLVNDYKDTDGHGGEINNLRTKDGRTIVWQNAAVDTVPILERQVVTSTDGSPTAIGTGGVVDRFDPLTSYFGNQHQWGLTATEYGFAWFDMRRKAFVTLSYSEGISEVSMVEGLKGFFDEAFLEVIGSNSIINNNLLNDPTFSKYSDRPLTGVGICGVYDPKFKMTYLTFKFIQRDDLGNQLNKDFTVGYYHPEKMFIGFYDWTPGISWNHNQIVLSANNPKNKTKSYNASMSSTTFNIGDVVAYFNREYICYSPVTIASYPGTLTQIPNYPGSSYWTLINVTNQLWVHNQPKLLGQSVAPDYMYNSFFGQVVNNELEFVVNPKVNNPFSVLNIEQEGNGVNFTDLYISTDTQSASDLSIPASSRFYRKIYDKITSSVPLSSTGRITSSWLVVRYVKKNWTTDPTVASTLVRILRYFASFFEVKR